LLKIGRPVTEGSGITSLLAFLVASIGAIVFWRALTATDAPRAVHGLYPEAEPKGKAAEKHDNWNKYAKARAAEDITAKITKSWITATVVGTDTGEGLFQRLKIWWLQRRPGSRSASVDPPTASDAVCLTVAPQMLNDERTPRR
jgi:hypothetical protein